MVYSGIIAAGKDQASQSTPLPSPPDLLEACEAFVAGAPMRLSRLFPAAALVVVLSVSALYLWNHRRTENREQRAFTEEGSRLQAMVLEMTSRWNAVTNWQGVFKGRMRSEIYTAEVERAILVQRPILLYAAVDDISPVANGYRVELSSPVTQLPLKMRYSLLCDSALAERLIAEKRGHWELSAVVAHIDRVEKRVERASVEVNGKDSFEDSYFFAEGTAKDVIPVGVHGLALARTVQKE